MFFKVELVIITNRKLNQFVFLTKAMVEKSNMPYLTDKIVCKFAINNSRGSYSTIAEAITIVGGQ